MFLVPTIPEHRHAQNESKDRVATAKRRGATRSPQGEHRTGEYVGEAAPLQRSGPEPGWGTFTETRRGIQAKTEDTASSPLMALRTAARRAPLGP